MTASRAPDNVLTIYFYDDYGALYALERGGMRYYVGSDHLGTPKVITDNTGAIVRQMEHDSWGVKIPGSDTNPGFDLPVGFAGGIPDDATGLVRFGFRDYEPGTGRWTAKDPLLFGSGQLNLFSYSGNSPVIFRDRSGLAPIGDVPFSYPTGTLVFGGQGSAVLRVGPQVAAGGYIKSNGETGFTATAGGGLGFNVGAGGYIGAIAGDGDLSGINYGSNYSLGLAGWSWIYDEKGNKIGGTLNVGPGLPGYSCSISATGVLSCREIGDFYGKANVCPLPAP